MRHLLAWLALLHGASCYNYLVFFPLPSRSHDILGQGMVAALVEAGHQVTHVTAYPVKTPHKLVTQISTASLASYFPKAPKMTEIHKMSSQLIRQVATNYSTHAVADEAVQEMMRDKSVTFDAVITEWFFTDIYVGFAQVFQCPWIHFAPSGSVPTLEYLIDEIQPAATHPHLVTGYTVPMSLKERVVNTFIVYYSVLEQIFSVYPSDAVRYEQLFGPAAAARGVTLAPYTAALHNISLLFLNSHPALTQPTRLPRNVVEIAGYHMAEEIPPLPKDLQNILDSSKGVIYFSMGSNLKSKDLPDDLRSALLAMFARQPFTVLWKFEADMPEAPSNVHVRAWMPQQSILSHKKTRVFITHGGMLSTTESLSAGVPTIAIPIFGDQFLNARRASKQGYSITVSLQEPQFVAKLEAAIEEIVNNDRYKKRATYLSSVFKDRAVPPRRLVTHWAEHVVRSGGAPHLRSPALRVPLWERYMLDVAALLAAAAALVAGGAVWALRKRGGRRPDKKKDN